MPPLERLIRPVVWFAAVLLLAGAPISPVRRAFASTYSAAMNVLLGSVTFGKAGHAHFGAGDTDPDGRKLEGEVSIDTVLVLTAGGVSGTAVHGLNARRDAYLPLVMLLAAVAATPLTLRTKARVLLLGFLCEGVVITASMWLFLVWDFAVGLGMSQLSDLSSPWRNVVDLAFRTLLLPPGNRFIIPLLIAAALSWRPLRDASASRAAAAAVASGPPTLAPVDEGAAVATPPG